MFNTEVSPELEEVYLINLAKETMDLQLSGICDMYFGAAKEVATELGAEICDVYEKWKTLSFQALYCLFIIAGSAMNFKSIINLSDAVTLFLAVPNLIAVFMLSNVIIKELKRYCVRYGVGIYANDKTREA